MTAITHAQLAWNDAGTPVSDHFDDVYFSNTNGLEETRYVFIEKNHLPQRWHEYDQRRFVIAETGFGTGLNFLATWQYFDQFLQQSPDATLKSLHFISFEKYPLKKADLIQAHQAWPELAKYAIELQKHYPIAVPECHRILLAGGAVTLDLWFGDIKDCLPKVPVPPQGLVDAWYLDGFAPSKNPEMWNQQLFNGMSQLAKSKATCATFTAAGFVRRGLIEAGFEMKKVKGFGTKREMIAGHLAHKNRYTNIDPCYHREEVTNLQEVAIIGGGIASATLAHALSQRGVPVTLYCADTAPAAGASGNRQGAVYPLLNSQHSGVSRVFAPAFLFARQWIEQIAHRTSFAHDWCGVTQLMWDEKSTEKLTRMLQGNFPDQLVQFLNQTQTQEKIGLPIDMPSLYYSLGGWLSPAELTQAVLMLLQETGMLTTYFEQPIEKLTWLASQQRWQLTSRDQTFEHQCVVIANGHQFDQFAQTRHIPLGKVKGQVSHAPTNSELQPLQTVLCYDGYMTPHSPDYKTHCIGASYDKHSLDYLFDPQAQQENAQRLARCIPNQSWPKQIDVSGNQSRQGIRCVSRDHLPFVGNIGQRDKIVEQYSDLPQQPLEHIPSVANYPHLYGILGLGSRGLSSAPLMAELLASQICGDPLPLPVDVLESLHPSRMWIRKLKKGQSVR
ncbi:MULTISPECIES: bifunctional tRNA (5-methylaminomethyl-2-thiouridine)(34)-methyltransferase MnmD/FAD-dependent 5-carboxymethylaminomethyl-2-thiouridine(34) oxidoreductase MnmC [unclassified Vibrio]|uniref:bifunctional tRNA (5-methylaminomethyl-2-thiouridine)(34)-methyltransferase MnmD/FAD-dependent 5-carboxymethylaminomethyl-2-thiouridine(34) oxidoreductase MnmC n=1 Tax=unclassified Vibrio TaxID=2614977 RepID=UPI0014834A65|nr:MULTISPECIES: bifunctional tRNA (5-methylaminomethyl-2-thiouridine)(34)-methyltransferase MnmD/FAD-dependent 5-carboxymethylaminomethyl-2-thiouridine(34) oxidoreductase MnmC [unclassified Vibrio]NNN43265.1 bifunctional tRNA (5-methylaminomethyl-2-thiouridine)(34)-methyltransferase MnmD/FAD-dependent 5-carboxymethylaminomethyl-2-thiouridine(34) oxidoreductase MnmC [Vibrio sp. 1-1(7)]NNN71089.1 bifunctional tRNA (5-methylaminomethyl-2-thiouridine)(34)-methyltransferase MnmD/FAD-dependent 5-carbo